MLITKLPATHEHLSLISVLFLGVIVSLTAMFMHSQPARAQSSPPTALCIIQALNPNFRSTRNRYIDTIVIHYSSGINVDPRHWSDPRVDMAIFKRLGVSAHYLIDRAGTVYQLVQEHNVAFHAGGSIMPAPDNRKNVNGFSIGIETIATATSGYTDAQYMALATIIRGIESRDTIRHIVGHDQIAGPRAIQLGLRRDLKKDPGPLFDWERLHSLLHEE